ncbi:hypothetical protein [Bradyrhizobium symbiodeficiens]
MLSAELVDVLNQFGVQSLCTDNCLARVVVREKAEDSEGPCPVDTQWR